MRVLNVFDQEMEEGPGHAGFWFRAAQMGAALGAARIGATLYEAREHLPIWPYHYHYPSEEWLYVLDGAPVLRDASGRRVLAAGDLACFPAGHRGAHTLQGPGRFVLFSAERSSGPFVSVYPDSDKISVLPGIETGPLNALRLIRAGSVDYWYGEGEDPVPAASVTREPEGVPGPPVVNVRDVMPAPEDGWRWASLGRAAGGAQLDSAILELDPGAEFGPYRYDYGRELWLVVLDGAPTVRHAEGERSLSPGDIACFPDGPAGGRLPFNGSGEMARILLLWTTGFPTAACYPDTGDWRLRTAAGADEIRLHE